MVRRRSTKTKGPSKGKPRPTNRNDSKIKGWDKLADIPVDDEDQFHLSRDKILLEGDDFGNEDDDGDENEVFGLKGMSEDEDEEDETDGRDIGELNAEDELPDQKSKKSKKKAKKNKVAESSQSSSGESDSEEETWGRSKSAYYSSNAADLESDDEEANELEEQEAKRLQTKVREAMVEDDFGLYDPILVEPRTGETDDLIEPIPVPTAVPLDVTSYIRHLEKTSPETLALTRDWDDTAHNIATVQQKIADLQVEETDALNLGMIYLYYQALLTYATTLGFYLHLRSSEKYAKHPEMLKSHPILSRLLTLKQSLHTLEALDFANSDGGDEEDSEADEDENIFMDAENLWELDRKKGLEPDELKLLLEDAEELTLSKSQSPSTEQPPKKKRKTASSKPKKPPNPVFDLVEPIFTSSNSSSTLARSDAVTMDPYGENTSLQHADAADKSARRKTLRFHTARIENASARRQGARINAVGGDDDLPYRERRKEKDIRLAKEAKAKVRGQGGEDLNDAEPEPKQRQNDGENNGDSGNGGDVDDVIDGEKEGADGYYELVQKKSKEKKAQKKVEYEAAQAATRPDLDVDEASGPRSLTRAILANKGLTPHRPKSVRNPRVKKRLKFEKAKKKVSSQKAVYKGGISDSGRYDGEKSGISKVIKSVRLA